MEISIVLLVLAGVVGGFIAGLLGVGGGVIYILVIPFFLVNYGVCTEEEVPYIIANSIFTIMAVSLVANTRRIKNKTFHYREVMLAGGAGALSSILCMEFIVQSQWYSKHVFNIIVVLLMLLMLFQLFKKVEAAEKGSQSWKLILIGVLAGAASSLSGLGGGVIFVPLLIYLCGMDLMKSKTISLGAIGIMAFALSAKNLMVTDLCANVEWNQGLIIFPISLLLSVGVIGGTPLGVRISKIISPKALKLLFGLMLAVVVVRKMIEISRYYQWL